MPWTQALRYSAGANLLTAVLGGMISGFAVYDTPALGGSRLNPNPSGLILGLLVVFGVLSAVVEAVIWRRAPTRGENRPFRRVLSASLAVHLLGVPLGLAILLLPERPYPGL